MRAVVGALVLLMISVVLVSGAETEEWFLQRLDHFNNLNMGTFKQRYYVNDDYYDPSAVPPAPIFLYINGEGKSNFYNTMLLTGMMYSSV